LKNKEFLLKNIYVFCGSKADFTDALTIITYIPISYYNKEKSVMLGTKVRKNK
jgi:hypothetical protein